MVFLDAAASRPQKEQERIELTNRWLAADPSIPERAEFLRQQLGDVPPSDLVVAIAPGRAEILGNHTDYNGGVTLSANIQKNLLMVGLPRDDGLISIGSLNQNAQVDFLTPNTTAIERQKTPADSPFAWSNYPKGVVWAYMQDGYRVNGFHAMLESTIPTGAGVSSSAAIELATLQLLMQTSGAGLSDLEQVIMVRRAENEYVGAPCGFLDQGTEALADGGMLLMDYRRVNEVSLLAMSEFP